MKPRDEHNVSARQRTGAGAMKDRRAPRGGDKAETREAIADSSVPSDEVITAYYRDRRRHVPRDLRGEPR